MLKQETVEVMKQIDLLTNYEDAIRYVLRYARNNQHILSCSYEAMGRAGLRRFFYDDFLHVLNLLICDLEKRMLLHMETVPGNSCASSIRKRWQEICSAISLVRTATQKKKLSEISA